MYSPFWLYFIPGLLFLLLGLIGAGVLFLSPFRIGSVVFDLNTFIVACFSTIVGVQLLTFSAISRQYAALNGLLPWSDRALLLDRFATTDRMAIYAAAMIVLGLLVVMTGLWYWADRGFGDIGASNIPRVVVSGLTLMVIGLQVLFAGFLIGILRIPLLSHRTADKSR